MSRIDEEALEWVARQAAGTLAAGEQAAFDHWYAANPRHQGAYLRACAIQHSLDQLTLQDNMRPGVVAAANDTKRAAPGPVRKRRALLWSGALAAGLGALAVGQFGLDKPAAPRTLLQTARGEFRKVPLADRSVVSINSDSRLELAMSASERRVFLEHGEAWFAVAKDKSRPFIVSAGDVRVRAVGTAFAVRRDAHGAHVLVSEGVVEVWSEQGGARRQRVEAGAQAFVNDGAADFTVRRDPADIARRLAWRDGRLMFSNATLADAVADFNRYNLRQIVIADPALRGRTLAGTYRIDQPEQFADDVRALWKVPVALTADSISIGARRAAARAPAGG